MKIFSTLLLLLLIGCTAERAEQSQSKSDTTRVQRDSLVVSMAVDQNSDKTLFPIYGITLGTTTIAEIRAMGYKCIDNGSNVRCSVNSVTFYDDDGAGTTTSLYFTYSDGMPDRWVDKFNFSFDKSYDDWITLLSVNGFEIKIIKEPAVEIYESRQTLSAEVMALSRRENTTIRLTFDYGNDDEDGYLTSSPRSLYSVSLYPSLPEEYFFDDDESPADDGEMSEYSDEPESTVDSLVYAPHYR
jgi:hypothetical protein